MVVFTGPEHFLKKLRKTIKKEAKNIDYMTFVNI